MGTPSCCQKHKNEKIKFQLKLKAIMFAFINEKLTVHYHIGQYFQDLLQRISIKTQIYIDKNAILFI